MQVDSAAEAGSIRSDADDADKWQIARRRVWTIGRNPAATERAYKRRKIDRKHRTHIIIEVRPILPGQPSM